MYYNIVLLSPVEEEYCCHGNSHIDLPLYDLTVNKTYSVKEWTEEGEKLLRDVRGQPGDVEHGST